jgi:hypothetical protein
MLFSLKNRFALFFTLAVLLRNTSVLHSLQEHYRPFFFLNVYSTQKVIPKGQNDESLGFRIDFYINIKK